MLLHVRGVRFIDLVLQRNELLLHIVLPNFVVAELPGRRKLTRGDVRLNLLAKLALLRKLLR